MTKPAMQQLLMLNHPNNYRAAALALIAFWYLTGTWCRGGEPGYLGIRYQMVEYAANGKTYSVPAGQRVIADLNSDVGLLLKPLFPGTATGADEDWAVFLGEGRHLEVTVQAFLDKTNGERTVLHVSGYDTLPLGELRSQWFDPLLMPKVHIELDRTKWRVGDRVTVMLRVRETGTHHDLYQRRFRVQAGLTGLHPRFSTALIFSRATGGSNPRWDANVMAQINWFDDIRNPRTKGGALWNWLGLGAGFHLASLDQSDDTVEFGLGVNLTLWKGLVTVGYGSNLSVEDNQEYKLVGLNLWDVLNGTQ